MKALRRALRYAALLAAMLLLPAAEAAAQNLLSIRDVTISPGTAAAVIPIDLAVDQDLSLLRFDITFDPSLCARLVTPDGITVRKAGRTVKAPRNSRSSAPRA